MADGGRGLRPEDAVPAGTLRASVDQLAFDAAMVGQRREARVLVLNTLETPRRVHFRADAAAFEGPEPVELPALGFREVRVRLTPGELGHFAGRLAGGGGGRGRAGGGLAAEAGPQPACRPRGPCRTSRLDLEQGVCVDGSWRMARPAARAACGGTCAAGTCVTASGELSATWRYTAPEGKALRFPGLVDAEGSVYWYEYAAG